MSTTGTGTTPCRGAKRKRRAPCSMRTRTADMRWMMRWRHGMAGAVMGMCPAHRMHSSVSCLLMLIVFV